MVTVFPNNTPYKKEKPDLPRLLFVFLLITVFLV